MKNSEINYPVSIIGIGPGDPDLLTVKAKRILDKSDIILYDCLANQCLLENKQYKAKTEFVEKDSTFKNMMDTIENYYRQGKKVARIRSGDAMMFNSGGIESRKIKERNIPFEVIPGITAACAASGLFAIPTTELEESDAIVHFISHDTPENFAHIREITSLLKYGTTLALYMANNNLPKILTIFKEENIEDNLPVAIVSRVSMPEESAKLTTLSNLMKTLEEIELRSPMVFFIGKHVTILKGEKEAI